jgi:putative copper resistance protein D
LQPKGREFEPRTLHSFLHGTHLLAHLGGAVALADSLASSAAPFGVESPAYVAIRAVMYLSALSIIGACAFILLIATRVSHLSGSYLKVSTVVPSTRRFATWATALLVLALVARLVAQGYMVSEGGPLLIAPLLKSTYWGWGWLVGACAAVVIAVALVAGRGSRASWRGTAVGTMMLALSFSLTGHAISQPTNAALFVLLDMVHVMAAGGWLGTLLVVSTIGLRTVAMLPSERRGHAAAELINAFSTFALLCVSTLFVTGTITAWSHLPTVSALWKTEYGSALYRKLIFIGLTGLVGAYNWRVVKPKLTSPGTIAVLRKSAAVEITIGVIVVILTAILVATSPPDADDMPMAQRANTSLLAYRTTSSFRHTLHRLPR